MSIEHNFQLRLIKKERSGKEMHHLFFKAPQKALQSFRMPGQFMSLQKGEHSGFFALANPPSQKHLEFLVKNSGPLGQAMSTLRNKAPVLASAALGQGFGLQEAIQKVIKREGIVSALHLFSMGSGLGPLRSVLLHVFALKLTVPGITLWQGSYDPKHLPFSKEYKSWSQRGVKLELCLDQKPGSGNIIEVLQTKRPDLQRAVACWAGSKVFGQSLVGLTAELGLLNEALLSNYA